MTERRFTDTEVATIIERATAAQEGSRQLMTTGAGMTLSQLQDIGRDVGIDPAIIAHAADSIDEVPATATPGLLGLPLRVERVVNLDRRLSEEEWERVVVDLRETFNARGVMRGEGSLRQWTNGNLQALLEPTAKGQRIRIRTFKGDALPRIAAGVAILATSAVMIAARTTIGAPDTVVGFSSLLFAAGVGIIGATVLSVSQWARRRRDQMELLADRWRRGP